MENKAMIISSDALDETFEARMSAMKKAMKKEFSIIIKNKDEEIAEKDRIIENLLRELNNKKG